jgi:dipeptidyl aminopeptidase/acylaminoacyl peptidase
MVLDLTTGDKKDLTASFDEGIAGTPVREPTGKGVYVPVHQKGTEQILYFSVDGKQAPTVVSAGRQNLGEVQLAVGGTLVCPRTAMDAPTDLILLNPKTKKQTFITEANKEMLANTMLPQVESKMVKTTDGKEMLVWHILPPNFDKAKRYPTLLYCQGGPQSPVSQAFSYRWNFMVMASQGFVVVAPCRRGMPGFGRKWNDDISGDWGGQPMRDYLSAIDDASALPYVDRDKLGCVGASYGGYSTFFLAGIHEKRFKAFISHCGVFNLESMAGTTEELFFNNYEFGGPYWNKPQPKSYTEFSPHKFVDKWDTPMLVIHGGLDFRVPEEQGMQAYTALQERGIPSKFVYFPDEGHWVMKPQNTLVWHREFYGWLGKYLK